mmetsp:Transcript_29650/g.44749  ORF Transcript_29650/g.44749 Transcript_29650/m.44749 type:complete len:222 (-) Transcript_29650:629-1294(-)
MSLPAEMSSNSWLVRHATARQSAMRPFAEMRQALAPQGSLSFWNMVNVAGICPELASDTECRYCAVPCSSSCASSRIVIWWLWGSTWITEALMTLEAPMYVYTIVSFATNDKSLACMPLLSGSSAIGCGSMTSSAPSMPSQTADNSREGSPEETFCRFFALYPTTMDDGVKATAAKSDTTRPSSNLYLPRIRKGPPDTTSARAAPPNAAVNLPACVLWVSA